ncbi:hypothetical protein [Spiroplasma endosymbiont of Danaus chrysippus]|nr:hypothetical protein [Spiroplasma endosymbiont of Danaus chrysippus]CAB1054067.1 hypothetical protein [Spiroplasma endosymbiont of Danaus chrysippus]
MKILLKIIDCLNPISIFKSIKKYIENRAKIEAKLIDATCYLALFTRPLI